MSPVALSRLKERIDVFFDHVPTPTVSGLAMVMGFDSVDEWKTAVTMLSSLAIQYPDANYREVLDTLNRAKTRIQIHYEEGMQSGRIAPQVGRYVLETLGFLVEVAKDQGGDSVVKAAQAARLGYQKSSGSG
jgi:hypothetical protein